MNDKSRIAELEKQVETLRNDLCLESAAHDETKQRIADLEKRIAVAVNIHKGRKQFVDNNLDCCTMEAVLTMSKSDFDKFCQKHPEYLP